MAFVSILYFKELYILPHAFWFFVHLTSGKIAYFDFEKSDLISAATLNNLDWIGFKKEFFPFLRYLRRSFTNELSCSQSLSVRGHIGAAKLSGARKSV